MWTNTRKSEKNIRRRLNKDILRSSFALPHGISTYLPTTSHEPPFLLLKTVENNHVILATLLSFPLLPPPPPLTHRCTPAHMGVKLQILVSASPQIMFFLFFIRLLEDCYIMKDPFSTSGGFICIGGNCSLCGCSVCMSNVSTAISGQVVTFPLL